MLVLSRRKDDKIVFPHLGITVEILKIAGRSVRVGVDAPPDVRVLRHELKEHEQSEQQKVEQNAGKPNPETGAAKSFEHQLRNRLNQATLGLQLAQKQLEFGQAEKADEMMANVLSEFRAIDQELSQRKRERRERGSGHALLVEDDANESELLAGFLRFNGFRVDTATDGCDALNYLSEHENPDLVLLDMHMPRCDGPSTISAIRDNPAYSDLRVFAVSGLVPAEVGVTVGPRGVDRWFRKPLDPQTLVKEMKQELELMAQ